MTSIDAARRLCDCGCGRTFLPPPSAPHKRFASDGCRTRWHQRRRAEAVQAWRGLVSDSSVETIQYKCEEAFCLFPNCDCLDPATSTPSCKEEPS